MGWQCTSGLPKNQHWNKKRAAAGKGAASLETERDAGSLDAGGLGLADGDEDYDAGCLDEELNPLDQEGPGIDTWCPYFMMKQDDEILADFSDGTYQPYQQPAGRRAARWRSGDPTSLPITTTRNRYSVFHPEVPTEASAETTKSKAPPGTLLGAIRSENEKFKLNQALRKKKEEVKLQVQETAVVSRRAPNPVTVGPPNPATQTASRPSTPNSENSSSTAELCKEVMMAVKEVFDKRSDSIESQGFEGETSGFEEETAGFEEETAKEVEQEREVDEDEFSDCGSSESGKAEFWDTAFQGQWSNRAAAQGELEEKAGMTENDDVNGLDAIDVEASTDCETESGKSDAEKKAKSVSTCSIAVSYCDLPRVTDDARRSTTTQHGNEANSKAKHRRFRKKQQVKLAREKSTQLIYDSLTVVDEYMKREHEHVMAMLAISLCVALGGVTFENERAKGLDRDISPIDQVKPEVPMNWRQKVAMTAIRIANMWQCHRGFTVDSGAADHVIPWGWVRFVQIVASIGSLAGVHYVAASGTRIPNQGEQRIRFMTRDGVVASLLFQVAKVNKPLCSVSKLIDDNMRVVFDKTGSYILNKTTGEVMRIKRERGVFVLEAFLPQNPNIEAEENNTVFSRHE